MARPVTVGITHGDFNGVGYEVIVKALNNEQITDICTPVVYAIPEMFKEAAKLYAPEMPKIRVIGDARDAEQGVVNVVDLKLEKCARRPGTPTPESGKAAVAALERAVADIRNGGISVMVTAPICKENVQGENFQFSGHTEFLNARAGEQYRAQMILFEDNLRVALVTTHLPLSEISDAVTQQKVADSIKRFNDALRRDFGIERPKIAVLSLNPHCGDGGLLGNEEGTVIIPAIEENIQKGVMAFGPFAADGFFADKDRYGKFDGVLAMYHDQGLAPFKTISRAGGVNFTAGLPFVRTSPDHGTAFDIAWQGKANPQSMREAIYQAIDIFRCRMNYIRASRNPLHKLRTEKLNEKNDKTLDLSKEEL